MAQLTATVDIAAEDFGAPLRARSGETFTASDDEAARLIAGGLAVSADSPDAALHRDARAALVRKRRE